jgi:hypothetical protein
MENKQVYQRESTLQLVTAGVFAAIITSVSVLIGGYAATILSFIALKNRYYRYAVSISLVASLSMKPDIIGLIGDSMTLVFAIVWLPLMVKLANKQKEGIARTATFILGCSLFRCLQTLITVQLLFPPENLLKTSETITDFILANEQLTAIVLPFIETGAATGVAEKGLEHFGMQTITTYLPFIATVFSTFPMFILLMSISAKIFSMVETVIDKKIRIRV